MARQQKDAFCLYTLPSLCEASARQNLSSGIVRQHVSSQTRHCGLRKR